MGNILSWFTLRFGFKSEKQQYKHEVMSETTNVDFKTITHEWEKSKHLYDVLKKKCHPDLYTGKQSEVATQLFLYLLWFSAEGITQ
mgnify:CR=1 FL=1